MGDTRGIDRNKWDISLRHGEEQEALVKWALVGVQTGRTEVKCDSRARSTGNLYVEYQQGGSGRWRKSGIAVTAADIWAFVIPDPLLVLLVETSRLKDMARQARAAGRKAETRHQGDMPTRGALVPIDSIVGARAVSTWRTA